MTVNRSARAAHAPHCSSGGVTIAERRSGATVTPVTGSGASALVGTVASHL